jgi:hypothetical protein
VGDSAACAARRLRRGSISLATLFAVLFLAILLGMVINTGRQLDSKLKMQNAADAATQSGGVALARGMNTLAFTNHLLCETFALTAFFREARDRHSEQLTPEILAAWERIAPTLAGSGFEKFERLGAVIPVKTQLEREMVRTYSDWAAASSELVLPVLEEMLATEAIPTLQRRLVQETPYLAQTAAAAAANRYGMRVSIRDQSRGPLVGVLWRNAVDPVGGSLESTRSSLPVVDPVNDVSGVATQRYQQAVARRDQLAKHYLRLWNNQMLQPFDQEGKMSQFAQLWRGFTCGQLEELIAENATRNIPHIIRETPSEVASTHAWLESDYQFVGVAYWKKLNPVAPGVFADSLASDQQAFAQGTLFLPRSRLMWYRDWQGDLQVGRNSAPGHWDLWNQNWSFQLMPANSASVGTILQQPPPTPAALAAGALRYPNLSGVSQDDLRRVTTH